MEIGKSTTTNIKIERTVMESVIHKNLKVNILLELSVATNVDPKNPYMSSGEQRIQEYVSGIRRFFKYEKEFMKNGIEIYLADNTIDEDQVLDKKIVNIIPEYVKIKTCLNNDYGCRNKGAGCIEQWKYCKEDIAESEWFIHYEPRQLLVNFNFFESFFKNPRTLFTKGKATQPHFNTGLFAIKSKNLIDYASSVNLEEMVEKQIGIEYSLHNFVMKNNIEYDLEENMNVIWLDSFTNKKYLW